MRFSPSASRCSRAADGRSLPLPGCINPRHIAQTHLGALAAAPAVDGERADDMHEFSARGEQRLAERLTSRTKCDGTDGTAVATAQTGPDMG